MIMKKINKFIELPIINGFVLIGALFILFALIAFIGLTVTGLWADDFQQTFIDVFEDLKLKWKKMLAVYIVASIVVGLFKPSR